MMPTSTTELLSSACILSRTCLQISSGSLKSVSGHCAAAASGRSSSGTEILSSQEGQLISVHAWTGTSRLHWSGRGWLGPAGPCKPPPRWPAQLPEAGRALCRRHPGAGGEGADQLQLCRAPAAAGRVPLFQQGASLSWLAPFRALLPADARAQEAQRRRQAGRGDQGRCSAAHTCARWPACVKTGSPLDCDAAPHVRPAVPCAETARACRPSGQSGRRWSCASS